MRGLDGDRAALKINHLKLHMCTHTHTNTHMHVHLHAHIYACKCTHRKEMPKADIIISICTLKVSTFTKCFTNVVANKQTKNRIPTSDIKLFIQFTSSCKIRSSVCAVFVFAHENSACICVCSKLAQSEDCI